MSALPSTSQPPSLLATTAAGCQLSRAFGRAKLSLGVSLVAKEPLLVKAGPSIRGKHPWMSATHHLAASTVPAPLIRNRPSRQRYQPEPGRAAL